MAVAVDTQGPFFTTGDISFSQMRRQFRAANLDGTFDNDTAAIRFSELYRVTDLTNTDPVVPDCTENRDSGPANNGIPTAGSISSSDFRRSIKFYFLNQTGTDTNLDLDAQNYNGNLNRNIRKRFRIEGICASSDNGDAAADFDAIATNVRLELMNNSRILGASGPGGSIALGQGGDGGDALTLNSTGGNNNVVFLNANCNSWGGGGGGDGGQNGSRTENSLQFYGGSFTGFTQCVPAGRGVRCFTVCDNDGGARSCRLNQPSGTQGTPGCQRGYSPPGCACGSCIASVNTTVSSNGTDGVDGRGFNNQTGGLAADPDQGGTAQSGGDGGDWGQPGNGPDNAAGGGGAGGASIGGGGANWAVTGTQNATTQRGATI